MDSGVGVLSVTDGVLAPRLVSALYVEAMVLADEVRAYFDESGREERDSLPPLLRVSFSCESLRVTTRLMHVIAWLLTWRAVEAGEITAFEARQPSRRVGQTSDSDDDIVDVLPPRARVLINASRELYQRVVRLEARLSPDIAAISPARTLFSRLEAAF